jgi:1-deoxy-D-xylulose-5-phosphate synthase
VGGTADRGDAILDRIASPSDLKALSLGECDQLAAEIRLFIVEAVSVTGGHLGSNLGAVELTIALHRVFDSPSDVLLFDTGHQAYVHKLLTGRASEFSELRQAGGLSGYPNRAESAHDVIENSHASTALSWAHGVAAGRAQTGADEDADGHVVAVVGDGALTGGMAYEALNNLGHSASRVVIVLNDNGRSYAPTISRLGREPHVFFEALGVRYTGPLDGHDLSQVEQALRRASSWPGPIVLHLLTRKGKGYGPAEEDEVTCLHDLKVARGSTGESYTDAFTKALLGLAQKDERIVAITAAMPGPTGLLSFEEAFPGRFFDVGIAEQHAMTSAAGMAYEGLRPVVCIYSTFLQRCLDQWNLDVGLHKAAVVVVADRAGITGDDGPSHHGIYDLHSALSIEGVAVYCPSEPGEIEPLLTEALASGGPALLRYPKTLSPSPLGPTGEPGRHRVLTKGSGEIVIVGIGKLARAALEAGRIVTAESGLSPMVIDPRVIRPADDDLVEQMARALLLITAEDGIALGGAGAYLASLAEKRAAHLGLPGPRAVVLGVPAGYIAQAKPDDILAHLGLDGPGIATSLLEAARRYGLAGLGGGSEDEFSTGGSELRRRGGAGARASLPATSLARRLR